MIFAKKKKILVWCDDPPEDRVISIVAGCLANHDRAYSLESMLDVPPAVTGVSCPTLFRQILAL